MCEQQQQKQEQSDNQNHLPSDWFYSSVMLTNCLDMSEHGNGSNTNCFELNELKSTVQSDISLLHSNSCQFAKIYNDQLCIPAVSLIKSTFQSSQPITYNSSNQISDSLHSNGSVKEHSLLNKSTDFSNQNSNISSYLTKTKDNIATNAENFSLQMHAFCGLDSTNNSNLMNDSSKNNFGINNCDDVDNNGSDDCSRKNKKYKKFPSVRMMKEDEIEVEVEDDNSAFNNAPPNVLYSPSTTNRSDKMKLNCGVRWPSKAVASASASATASLSSSSSSLSATTVAMGKQTEVISSSSHQHITGNQKSTMPTANDNYDNNSNNNNHAGRDKTTVPTIVDKSDSDNIVGNNEEDATRLMTSTLKLPITSNYVDQKLNANSVDRNDQDFINNVSCSTQSINSDSLTTAFSVISASAAYQLSQRTAECERLNSYHLSFPGTVPIKKRRIYVSPTTVTLDTEKEISNTYTMNLPNINDNSSKYHHQFLYTTAASDAPMTSNSTDSAFSSCSSVKTKPHSSTNLVLSEHTIPSITTYSKLFSVHTGCISTPVNPIHVPMSISNSSGTLSLNTALEMGTGSNYFYRNVFNSDCNPAQEQNTDSTVLKDSLPSLLSVNSNEQKLVEITDKDKDTCISSEQCKQSYHQNVYNEKIQSHIMDESSAIRCHPYETNVSTCKNNNTSNDLAFWSQAVPSRVDLKQNYLRSLAPVLYDLLSDDCESQNCQKTTDSIDRSILKSCIQSSMDSYA
ncbi:unnamed protein product [Thelazia callipaeda]|uniref:POU domain protein n=1 Tax=Thelazia callipaeda TaxID=103827 RepID=A0A0N5CQI7_THECL|nr:unnamed protein product [Thelazia callipaeda]